MWKTGAGSHKLAEGETWTPTEAQAEAASNQAQECDVSSQRLRKFLEK
jgi:hypothetical protein